MKIKSVLLVLLFSSYLVSNPTFAADKPSVGIADFKNTATGVYWWRGGVGRDLSGMVANELASTDHFRVVERSKLNPVLKEQDLMQSGRMAKSDAAQYGKLTGAEYMVMGTLTAFERNTSNQSGRLSFGGISIGGKKDEAYLAVDLRVVDTTTGEIAFNRTVEARSGGTGLNLGFYRGGLGGKLGSEEKTPVGKAIRAVVAEIVGYLDCVMVEKDSCIDNYDAKEEKRKGGLMDAIKLD